MIESLQPILALLDEGLSLYRRHFVPFVLIAASWFVPLAIISGLLIFGISWDQSGLVITLLIIGVLLLFPLLIYLIGGLSRATIAAVEGRPVRFREALAIRPLRALGMGCFTIVYYILAQTVSSLLSIICICPVYIVGVFAASSMSALFNNSSAIEAGVILFMGMFFVAIYICLLFVGGASYSSLIYGLQPWVQEQRPFGESIQISFDYLTYHFRRNLLIWGLTALLVTAVGLIVTLTIGLALPLPLTYLLGANSPVTQAVSASSWLIGLVIVLPPLPIWMALLYRRNRIAREGSDLQAEVDAWWQQSVSPPSAIISDSN